MIDRAEILDFAGQLSLQPQIVEKDYVLGWVLAAIGQHPNTRDSWIFKGGTCLKKVYFETYRFSEDLDFTLRDERQLDGGFLLRTLREVAAWVYDQCGVAIPPDQIRLDVYTNPRGRPSAEARLYYRGPIAPGGDLPAIRFDLTADETVVLPPERQRVWHPYSDAPEAGIDVLCYAFAEVFAEKIRALGERRRPRDLYDVVNLFRRPEAREHAGTVRNVLETKCRYKGIGMPDYNVLAPHRGEIEADWRAMLAAQLPELPDVAAFWAELPQIFEWLKKKVAPPIPPARPLAAGEQVIRVGLGRLAALGGRTSALETIRFAAANHLCVDLEYVTELGRPSTRTIEPYSLRRSREGHVLLHAERADGGGHRAYRIDRITGARVTNRSFVPRFAIELTPAGFQPIRAAASSFRSSSAPSGRRRRRVSTGTTYVYECSWCGRRFSHKERERRLNPHKDKNGWPCSGKTGSLVDTRF